jgi:hypothetical protein
LVATTLLSALALALRRRTRRSNALTLFLIIRS